MKRVFFFLIALIIVVLSASSPARAQQYKLKQTTSVMGMKSESTIYVKGMRKRTEGGGMMGMGANLATIEQCDLQRSIKLNTQKKLYFIEPFSKNQEEVIDEDVKPVAVKTKPATTPVTTQKGGTITMWYNISDTGERKKVWGFTARHVWTYQKMKPSADACTMKDSIIIKTDGWYIDLPQFNCPVQYKPSRSMMPPNEQQKPDCIDKFVTRRSGKGKLGFPITETRTIIMGGQGAQTSEFKTDIETLELTTMKLDSMLFEIPPGYTEVKSETELQDKMDINAMIKQYGNVDANEINAAMNGVNSGEKKPGMIRIGVYQPTGDQQVQGQPLQEYLVLNLRSDKAEAIAVNSEEEAKEKKCDYSLATDFTKIKSASKVGGLLKAIKNSDPNAASSFNIEAGMTLIKLQDGSVRLQPKLDGKYEGKVEEAEKRVLEEGARQVLKELK
ncbi:MAG: hypothetical protein HOP10_05370 [Chitinophagaceae bacterium]|nr:hypothetical protein [Chitinophagaceae bacterium]